MLYKTNNLSYNSVIYTNHLSIYVRVFAKKSDSLLTASILVGIITPAWI